jgi:hypothetical protein
MSAYAAKGQYVVKRETIVVENDKGEDVVNISSDSDDGEKFTVQVAGIKINFRQQLQKRSTPEPHGNSKEAIIQRDSTPMLLPDGSPGMIIIDTIQMPEGLVADIIKNDPTPEIGPFVEPINISSRKTIRFDEKSGNMVVEKKRRKYARPGHIAQYEIGLNMLPTPDYSSYTADYADYGTFLDLRHGLSQQWAFSITDFSFNLAPYGIIAFSTGLQMVWNNYVFANDITLVKDGGRLVPADVVNPKKTKLATFGFQIPVLLEINMAGRIFIAGGAYGGVNLGMNTKVKFPKNKMRDPYMSPFYYGVTGRVGYDNFYVYANYGLSNLFQANKGPEVAPLTIGVGIGF